MTRSRRILVTTARTWNETTKLKQTANMADGDEDFRREVRDRIRHCILNIMHELELRIAENGNMENLQQRLEWLLSLVVWYHQTNLIEWVLVDLISEALACLTYSFGTANNDTTERIFSGSPGRPKFNISYEQLNFLVERRFTAVQITELLGVSLRTFERRLRDFGLSIRATYTDVTNGQLDATILEILVTLPNTGYKRMSGYLRTRGFRIQQKRIRESMRRVDPQGTLLRALEMNVIHRRVYSVPSPLALWHIDGNHKLIRYSLHFQTPYRLCGTFERASHSIGGVKQNFDGVEHFIRGVREILGGG